MWPRLAAIVPLLVAVACGAPASSGGATTPRGAGSGSPGPSNAVPSAPAVTSPPWLGSGAFENGGTIPREHTCDGANRSPALWWNPGAMPERARTQSFALVMHDPDAPRGDFTHWVLYNLPGGGPTALAAGASGHLPASALEGKNDGGSQGYTGPCPPRGPAHRYVFDLYAVDRDVSLGAGATKAQVLQAIAGHVVAQTQFLGRYARA